MTENILENRQKLTFHITYNNLISLNDYVEIMECFRLAMNDAFDNYGVKRRESNKSGILISAVKEGSIILDFAVNVAAILAAELIIEFSKLALKNFKVRLQKKNIKNTINHNISNNESNIDVHIDN